MNILITGGASGLGEAITRKLAADPVNRLFITYARSAENAKALEAEFPGLKAIRCDFKSADSVAGFVNTIGEMNLDALVNNAMTGFSMTHFHKLSDDYFRSSFLENILPVLQVTKAALLQFKKKKSGRIITILSSYIAGNPPIGLSEYVAAKNYLLSMSKSWANEYAAFKIISGSISPSFMLTPMNKEVDERVIEEMISRSPGGKLLTVEETAAAVETMLQAGPEINGTNLILNAGGNVI